MKSLRKILFIILCVVAALVVCVTVFVHLFGNSVLKARIESAASKTLSVAVKIDDMDLSILGGKVGFQNLTVDNPPDYKHDKLLEVGDARIAVGIGSLLKDTVRIKEIVLDRVDVVLEQKGVTSNNIQDIIKSLRKDEGTEPKDDTGKASKKLHIDILEITNITVKAKLLPIPGKADTVTLKLNPIRMRDLGSDNKLDTAKLSGKILMAIATGVAEQGAGVLPENLTDNMKATLSKATELGKTAAEEGKKILEQGTDAGKELIEGVKGLLKPKK